MKEIAKILSFVPTFLVPFLVQCQYSNVYIKPILVQQVFHDILIVHMCGNYGVG